MNSYHEIGVKKAAEQLGIVYSILADWRQGRNTMRKEKPLMKENAELKEANEILKDAMSFFVKDRRK